MTGKKRWVKKIYKKKLQLKTLNLSFETFFHPVYLILNSLWLNFSNEKREEMKNIISSSWQDACVNFQFKQIYFFTHTKIPTVTYYFKSNVINLGKNNLCLKKKKRRKILGTKIIIRSWVYISYFKRSWNFTWDYT